jgi:hypothetical protein
MKRKEKRESTWLLLALLMVAAAMPTNGATVRRLPLEEVRDNSVSVFRGEVIGRSMRLSEQGNMVWTDYEISVSEHLGGTDPGATTTVSFAGGAAGGMIITIPGVPRLEVGEAWVFFLQEGDRRPAATVGWGQGLFRVARVSLEGQMRDLIVSWDGEPLEIGDDGRLARGPLVLAENGTVRDADLVHGERGARMNEPIFTAASGETLPRVPVAEPEATPLAQRRFATLDDLRLFVAAATKPAGGTR